MHLICGKLSRCSKGMCQTVWKEKGGIKSGKDQGDMWWWNEEVKNTITRNKATLKALYRFLSEEIRLNTNA